MGALLRAECVSGYTEGTLFLGGRAKPGGPTWSPAPSFHCNKCVIVDLRDDQQHCPDCSNACSPYDMSRGYGIAFPDEDDDEDPIEPVFYTCPRCMQPTMRLDMAGVFD